MSNRKKSKTRSAAKPPKRTSDCAPIVGHFAVGFFDLLGQRQVLRNIPRDMPSGGFDETFEIVKESCIPLFNFRKDLLDQVERMRSADLTSAAPSEEQRRLASEYQDIEFKSMVFSDSVLIWAPISSRGTNNLTLLGLHRLTIAAAFSVIQSLARGYPIRGAIDVGIGIDFGKDLYGPAIMNAYDLESEKADWPRVIIGPGVVELMNMVRNIPTALLSDPWERMLMSANQRFAESVKSLCIRRDGDNFLMVDLFAKPLVQLLPADMSELFSVARAQAERLMIRNQSCEKHAAKYAALIKYLDDKSAM